MSLVALVAVVAVWAGDSDALTAYVLILSVLFWTGLATLLGTLVRADRFGPNLGLGGFVMLMLLFLAESFFREHQIIIACLGCGCLVLLWSVWASHAMREPGLWALLSVAYGLGWGVLVVWATFGLLVDGPPNIHGSVLPVVRLVGFVFLGPLLFFVPWIPCWAVWRLWRWARKGRIAEPPATRPESLPQATCTASTEKPAVAGAPTSGATQPRPLQFTVGSILLLMLAVSVAMAWLSVKLRPARAQKAAIMAIRRAGGEVYLQRANHGRPPYWLRKLADQDYLGTASVSLGENAGDADLIHLKDLSSVSMLYLSGSGFTDAGFEHVAPLRDLAYLTLYRTGVTDVGLKRLDGQGPLETLGIYETHIDGSGLRHLTGLVSLTLLDTGITDTGLENLSRLKKLRSIKLEEDVTDAALGHLAGLTNLEVLNLVGSHVTGTGLHHLRNLKRLGALLLDSAPVTDAGLSNLPELPSLYSLSLRDTEISDAGLEHLKSLSSLEALCLSNTRITGTGLAHLKELAELHWLQLDDTQITDAGLEHLKALPNLQRLDLDDTSITDGALIHLKGLPVLQWLWLNNTRITNAGLKHLAGLRSLEYIELEGTQVTPGGVQKLQQALPQCKIYGP